MANLYELSSEYARLMAAASIEMDEETGEVPESIAAALDAIEGERNAKIDACLRLIKNLKADMEAYKEEAKRLANKAKATENHIESIRSWVAQSLEVGEKIKTVAASVSCRETQSVEIVAEVPEVEAYCTISYRPSMTKIKERIEAGESVDFAQVVTKKSITIR